MTTDFTLLVMATASISPRMKTNSILECVRHVEDQRGMASGLFERKREVRETGKRSRSARGRCEGGHSWEMLPSFPFPLLAGIAGGGTGPFPELGMHACPNHKKILASVLKSGSRAYVVRWEGVGMDESIVSENVIGPLVQLTFPRSLIVGTKKFKINKEIAWTLPRRGCSLLDLKATALVWSSLVESI